MRVQMRKECYSCHRLYANKHQGLQSQTLTVWSLECEAVVVHPPRNVLRLLWAEYQSRLCFGVLNKAASETNQRKPANLSLQAKLKLPKDGTRRRHKSHNHFK